MSLAKGKCKTQLLKTNCDLYPKRQLSHTRAGVIPQGGMALTQGTEPTSPVRSKCGMRGGHFRWKSKSHLSASKSGSD